MRIRPIHFVPDVPAAVRFYEALGLRVEVSSRSAHWIEMSAAGGELGLHDGAVAADGEGRQGLAVNFVSDEPLEEVERRLAGPALCRRGGSWIRSGAGRCMCGRRTGAWCRSTSRTVSSTHEARSRAGREE